MRESSIEKYLVQRVRSVGGEAYKFTSPNRRNVPDRICLFPNGKVIFIECKATGEKPTASQKREIKKITKLGSYACWVDSFKDVDAVIESLPYA